MMVEPPYSMWTVSEIEAVDADRLRLKEQLAILHTEYENVWKHKDNILKRAESAEAEVKHWKQDWNRVAKERNDALGRLAKAQELLPIWRSRKLVLQTTYNGEDFSASKCADELEKALGASE